MNKRLLFVFVASSCGVGLPALAQDQVIRLTTTKSAGETMTLVTNSVRGGISVDWGDGSPVTYEQDTVTAAVRGTDIVVTASSNLTEFNCDGNGLSGLDVSSAPYLRSLSCAGNELTTLTLTALADLEELNCAGNQLTRLVASSNTNLQRLYASGNSLRTFTGVSSLEVLDVSDNALSSLSVSAYSSLVYLDCSNNSLRTLSLNSPSLTTLLCADNQLTTLTLPDASLPSLRDIVVTNNSLTRLNLSAATAVQGIYCANNGLTSVTLPSNLSTAKTLDAYDCDNNSLTFASLPSSTTAPDLFSYTTQSRVDLSSVLNAGEGQKLDFLLTSSSTDDGVKQVAVSDYLLDATGSRVATLGVYAVESDGSVTALTSGTDYRQSSSGISFLLPQDRVQFRFEGSRGVYKDDGFYIATVPFAVYPSLATGIDKVTAAADGLDIDVNGTSVTMSASSARNVRIYTVSGQLVWQGTVDAGGTTVPLSRGVYLVGNKKIAL